MDELVKTLQETERLLGEVENRLTQIKNVNLQQEVRDKLLLLLRKHTEFQTIIHERKEEIVKLLIEITLLTGKKEYRDCYNPGYDYVILSGTSVEVRRREAKTTFGPWVVTSIKKYSPKNLAEDKDISFFGFCDEMIKEIKIFIRSSPSYQKNELRQLDKLFEKISELAGANLESV